MKSGRKKEGILDCADISVETINFKGKASKNRKYTRSRWSLRSNGPLDNLLLWYACACLLGLLWPTFCLFSLQKFLIRFRFSGVFGRCKWSISTSLKNVRKNGKCIWYFNVFNEFCILKELWGIAPSLRWCLTLLEIAVGNYSCILTPSSAWSAVDGRSK